MSNQPHARGGRSLSHHSSRVLLVAVAGIGVLCGAPYAVSAEAPFRVLHHQAVQVRSRPEAGAAERVTFDAYGRRFTLTVKPNERIRRALSSTNGTTTPFEGTVENAQGSWVRITRSPSGWRGMIYDGESLYAIEPASDVTGSTVEPLMVSGSSPVVYRLDDALLPVENLSCDVVQPDEPSTAASAFQRLSAELHTQAATGELTAFRQVRVGVVGDYEFVHQFDGTGVDPEDAVVARMNIVDGIFTSQVGVKITLAPPTFFYGPADPFTRSKAGDLLAQLRTWRGSSPTQLALGLTHLMTGRDLDGSTVGIAYIGSVCDHANAASLSEGRRSTTQSALIAAHEIGHNFNAPHDGEGACASTPPTFLMSPKMNGSDQFSACSIRQMWPIVSTARCLTAYVPPDAALEIPSSSLNAAVGTPFDVSFTVRALGDDASTNVNVTATLPTTLELESVSTNGGDCSSGAGIAMCSLGTLTSGDTRRISLRLRAMASGSSDVDLALTSPNDSNASNNRGTIRIDVSEDAPPPPTGDSTLSEAGRGGGGQIDFALLALLGSLMLACGHRRFACVRCTRAARR